MQTGLGTLPNDVSELKKIVQELVSKQAELQQYKDTITSELERYKAELQAEKEKYAALQRLVFGQKSEKKSAWENPKQEMLFNEAETYATEEAVPHQAAVSVAAHERKKTGRKPFPAHLERNEILHTVPCEERTCQECGTLRPEIGEERTEELRLIPAKAVIDVHVVKKYGPCQCGCCGIPIIQAKGPAKIIPGSRFSNGTIAFFLTSKFVDAQPFYRMEGILSRWGIDTGRSTLCNLAMNVGRATGDLVQAIRDDVLRSPVIGMDETSLKVLHETNRSAASQSYMWVTQGYQRGKRLIFYHYHPTRSGSVASTFLKGYAGYLQTDGYAGYTAVGESPSIIHVGCMAHVRRKFFEADKIAKGDGQAGKMLAMIGELYRDEAAMRQKCEQIPSDSCAFLEERRQVQQPKLEAMYAWLVATNAKAVPSSLLGKAISYALGQWGRVTRYLDHELLTPDNNMLENAIRPFVIGRKNWLFSNTPRGAHVSAGLYSLIETAKACGHEPYKYLCHVFDRLPTLTTKEDRLSLLPYNLDPTSY
jgi:transposase